VNYQTHPVRAALVRNSHANLIVAEAKSKALAEGKHQDLLQAQERQREQERNRNAL
jgi:hypothetical protein